VRVSKNKTRSTAVTPLSSLPFPQPTLAVLSLALIIHAGLPVSRVNAEEPVANSASSATPGTSARSAMDRFLDRLTMVEAGGRETAKNPRSSALGPFQFITSTFLDIARRHFMPETVGLKSDRVLALRTDRAFSRRAAEIYTRESAAILSNNTIVPTRANLRLAYLLGPVSAVRVLKAGAETPVQGILGGAVVRANPFMKGMTAGDLARWSQRNMDGRVAPDPTPVVGSSIAGAPMLPLEASETIATESAMTAVADPRPVDARASLSSQRKAAAHTTIRRVVTLAAPAPCRSSLASCRKWIALNSGPRRVLAGKAAPKVSAKRPAPQRNRIVNAWGRGRAA
jgi:hypothetical protein